jgi:uncharacterized protein (TIGR00730 family)
MNILKRIVVFCGASPGFEDVYGQQAYLTGKTLAQRGIELIYGGADIGLMGSVARGALENGGKVTGVFPVFLNGHEIAHKSLTTLIEVNTMHERKLKMHELSDGVIALPGGFGTLEELFEMLTWAQLGLHSKPIGLLNVNGFYDDLIAMHNRMVTSGFLKESNRDMLLISNTIEGLLEKMEHTVVPAQEKWITREKT